MGGEVLKHGAAIRREIVERVLARRGRLHLFDSLDPKKSALVVISEPE